MLQREHVGHAVTDAFAHLLQDKTRRLLELQVPQAESGVHDPGEDRQ